MAKPVFSRRAAFLDEEGWRLAEVWFNGNRKDVVDYLRTLTPLEASYIGHLVAKRVKQQGGGDVDVEQLLEKTVDTLANENPLHITALRINNLIAEQKVKEAVQVLLNLPIRDTLLTLIQMSRFTNTFAMEQLRDAIEEAFP